MNLLSLFCRVPCRRRLAGAERSAAHQNVALCTDSRRYGRSHAFYAKADIPAHAELYFSYGAGYWSHRGVVPEDPPPL